jgi:putative membrane protein
MLVAAPLVVLGRTLAVFIWALPLALRRAAGLGAKSKPVDILWRLVTNPFAAWTVHALVLWVWHAATRSRSYTC